jgi:TonB family protein
MTALGLSVAGHLTAGAILLGIVLWGDWSTPRVHVVNLVPSVAAVGAPTAAPAPPIPVPPAAPRAPAPAPPEPRPVPVPPRAAAESSPRPREALALPSTPPRPAPLPPRPLALPRPGEKELPPLAHAARPTAPPLPAPERAAEPRPAPPTPLGQATGSSAGSGALTLDVSDFPHAWYLRQVLRKVEEQWQRQALTQEPTQKPMVIVEIQRNGSIQVPRVEKTSGNAFYDQAALRAIMDASPFPELPRDWPRPVLRVMFRFDLKQG